MSFRNEVEFADRISRKRALVTGLAALAFLLVQVVARPVFRTDGYGASGPRAYVWALDAGLLLLLLLPVGGVVWGGRVRALVNDEIARAHTRAAAAAGFWIATLTGLVIYVLPAANDWTAREVSWVIVTGATGVAVLTFAALEVCAHQRTHPDG